MSFFHHHKEQRHIHYTKYTTQTVINLAF